MNDQELTAVTDAIASAEPQQAATNAETVVRIIARRIADQLYVRHSPAWFQFFKLCELEA